MTAFINGRKVHDAPAPAECDPWLALLCRADQSGPCARSRSQEIRESPRY